MKNRKLFAILTLVAFMMTLLPMAAFAAESLSFSASYMRTDKDSDKTGDAIKFTVVTRKADGTVIKAPATTDITSANPVYIWASSDALAYANTSGTITFDTGVTAADIGSATGAKVATFNPDTDGRIEFTLTSSIAGDVTVKILNGPANNDASLVLDTKTVTFTADSADVNSISIKDDQVGSVTAGTEVELTATVVDSNSNGIEGEKVTFYQKKGTGDFIKIGEATTDFLGEADLKITVTDADSYEFKAEVGSKATGTAGNGANETLTVTPADPVSIEAVTADGKVFDVDETGGSKVEFIIKDFYGNKITATDKLEIKVTDAPEDSNIEDNVYRDTTADGAVDTIAANADGTATAGIAYNSDDELYTKIDFDEIGEYKVKGTIRGTGISKTITVSAADYGDIQGIKLDYNDEDITSVLAKGAGPADTITIDVVEYDENGVEKDVNSSDYKVYVSDVNLLTISSKNNGNVVLSGPTDDSDKRGVVTVTVRHDDGYTASIDVAVVGSPSAIDVTPTYDGKKVTLALKLVDNEGNASEYAAAAENFTVVADGLSVVKKDASFPAGESNAEVTLEAEEYGSYDVTIITDSGIAKTVTLDFNMPKEEKPVYGAKNVTMFIGSSGFVKDGAAATMDQAPFIQDNRTFVPVRMVGEALGAEVEYDAATQVITLTRPDMTITMTVGSNVLVKSDGTSVVSDVAPFIVVETGRTVIPFRAIAEAFGATVEAVFAADGTVTAVTFAQ